MMKIEKSDDEKKIISKSIVQIIANNGLSYSEAVEVLEIAQNVLKDCKVVIQ